jgi:glycosyltransferase involved in cell wall biosynthesis
VTAAVHQFVPTLRPRDAVAAHARHVRRALRDAGLESEIFVERAEGAPAGDVAHFREFRGGRSGTWLLYQLSTGSPMARFLQARPEPRIVSYHNVTPASFFAVWDPAQEVRLRAGRHEMRQLAAGTALGLAVSGFNRAELDEAGYRRTAVTPVLLDPADLDAGADGRRLDELVAAKAGGGPDLLFVGRLAPNKCQHDLVKALAVYRRLYGVPARLHLVGDAACPPYAAALRSYVADLGLEGAVRFHGSVPPGALAAAYRAADVFVCLSEHEGFCVPLLEAWHHGVPVVAFAAAAVPETVAGAGLLLTAKDPAAVAAAVHRVVADAALRRRLVAAGAERLTDFSLERGRRALLAAVGDAVAAAA